MEVVVVGVPPQPVCDVHGQAGLPDSGRSGDHDHGRVAGGLASPNEGDHVGDVLLAPGEIGDVEWKLAHGAPG